MCGRRFKNDPFHKITWKAPAPSRMNLKKKKKWKEGPHGAWLITMCVGFGYATRFIFSTSMAMGCTTILFFGHVHSPRVDDNLVVTLRSYFHYGPKFTYIYLQFCIF